jgi:uncharacterized membrane protein
VTFVHCLITIALGILPISELRGAIPYAYFNGAPLYLAALIGFLANLLVAPLGYLFLGSLHNVFYRIWGWYRSFFDRFIQQARKKVERHFNKWGYIGLALFVGVPLPVTGAWTAVLGSWVLGLKKKETILAISLGVLISATIVTLVIALGAGIDSIFIKRF